MIQVTIRGGSGMTEGPHPDDVKSPEFADIDAAQAWIDAHATIGGIVRVTEYGDPEPTSQRRNARPWRRTARAPIG